MFLVNQITVLAWFLKDHVTLKTRVWLLKIQLNQHRNRFEYFNLIMPE